MHHVDIDALEPARAHALTLTPDLGAPVEVPCTVIRGAQDGPTVLVTAGVHGAEYASIEAASRMARTDPSELRGTLIVLPIVNPPAFFARSIYVNPLDGKNLNRSFPGCAGGTFAERLAHWLTGTFFARADALIDLHGGDMIESLTPFSITAAGHAPSLELAEAFGLPLLVESGGTGMTYAAATSLGVPAVLAEASGLGRWPDHEVERLTGGVQRALQHLGSLAGTPEPRPVRRLSTFAWLRSEHRGLWRPTVTGGDEVRAGQEVGTVHDLHGAVLQRATSPQDGVVLFAVESLAIGVDDPLVGIGA
ncbi:MAG: succinylglutamate desuccinylase/aspartoacylase family protein [Trueperaceae bacterium]